MSRLSGKIVFITGASAGIGAACALAFAREGCRLLLAARRDDRLLSHKSELISAGAADVHTLKLDVRSAPKVVAAIESLPDEWKPIEVLVNNAGLSRGLDKIQSADLTDWEEMIDTNIKGLLYITRAVLPGMVERASGHVINIGSIAGHEVYPSGSVYCATKHAVRALNSGMRIDLLGTGVRVTTVDPGMVETEFSMVRFRGDETRAKSTYAGLQPLTGDDIADAVVYAASRPPHVNINSMVVMPTAQASVAHVHRNTAK